jgi:hypothetical protein
MVASWVHSDDINLQLRGVVHLRKYLSVRKSALFTRHHHNIHLLTLSDNINRRIDVVLQLGLTKKLIHFLERDIPLLQVNRFEQDCVITALTYDVSTKYAGF